MSIPRPSREALKAGYRSGLELKTSNSLNAKGVPFEYETTVLYYLIPARVAYAKPDFLLLENGILVETKGRFVTSDRTKHKHIRQQHPDLDLRLVFDNPNSKIGKKSKTTYAMWCERNGYLYAAKDIPDEWLQEPPTEERWAALERAKIKPILK